MGYPNVDRFLVDARTPGLVDEVTRKLRETDKWVGVDCETQDTGRHAGLNRYCKYRPDGSKPNNSPLVFDTRKTVITGFSIYIEGDDAAYYFNLAHADEANRIAPHRLRELFIALACCRTVAHNAAYEIMAFKSLGFKFDSILCTMQLAASAYGPDEYSREAFLGCGRGTLAGKYVESLDVCEGYEGDRSEPAIGRLFASVLAKESSAEASYNGFVRDIAYSYGLKKAVRMFCGYEMASFEDTLQGKPHMGMLTGQEAAFYGCDDAIWCMRLLEKLLDYVSLRSPEVVQTFLQQENPMVPVYADLWTTGCRIDLPAVSKARGEERTGFVKVISDLKDAINDRLPFPADPSEELVEREPWYAKNWMRYRSKIEAFARSEMPTTEYEVAQLVRGAVPNAWATELKRPESDGPNLGHYMVMRTILYDLCGLEPIVYQGKVQSDAEARGALLEAATQEGHPSVPILHALSELARIEQAMKLYVNPYMDLTDPETNRVYPVVSSELATRRMASRYPNPMQLSKYGKSNYVRGFYLPDEEDHVLISMDWSGVELVIIGELSKDPEFRRAYGQLPHGDLHIEAAAAALGTTVQVLDEIKKLTEEVDEYEGIPLVDYRGRPLSGPAYWKWARSTDGFGKSSNFGYWYSGSLMDLAKRHRWSQEHAWEVTDRYREKFKVAEEWRLLQLHELHTKGYVKLPDGHRRYRYECTDEWRRAFLGKFSCDWSRGVELFWKQCADSIQRRGGNQGVNALVQGTNATLAKRSIIRLSKKLRDEGWDPRDAVFKIPVHDELVYSVRKDLVRKFLDIAVPIMKDHPDIFETLVLDVGTSVGLTFQPYDVFTAPVGQIELQDTPAIAGVVPEGGRATGDDIDAIVDYLITTREGV